MDITEVKLLTIESSHICISENKKARECECCIGINGIGVGWVEDLLVELVPIVPSVSVTLVYVTAVGHQLIYHLKYNNIILLF